MGKAGKLDARNEALLREARANGADFAKLVDLGIRMGWTRQRAAYCAAVLTGRPRPDIGAPGKVRKEKAAKRKKEERKFLEKQLKQDAHESDRYWKRKRTQKGPRRKG